MDMLLVAHADAYSRPGVADETIVLLWIIGNAIIPQYMTANKRRPAKICALTLITNNKIGRRTTCRRFQYVQAKAKPHVEPLWSNVTFTMFLLLLY